MEKREYQVLQLGRYPAANDWHECRCWLNKDRSDEPDRYELGEPVYIPGLSVRAVHHHAPVAPEGGIWWIRYFLEDEVERGFPSVVLGMQRKGGEEVRITARGLSKLNPMERLAAEYHY